ncbi:GntR family transcriptional regulator [Thermus scotoductus]|uniref:GntR family transcriptional regulator n=1 Tax=Thermus scotoductus TaxID=37636 RepID=UPI000571A2EC|nr:GntR family transcriptional regulator [Thermus scotoductus]
MSKPIVRTTLAQEAYRVLRRAILNRTYPPGTKLVVRELAEGLGLSPTPVKEALAALEKEGLVQAIPHRGYIVPKPDLEAIREIYELREVLEGLAARLATLRASPELTQRLRSLYQKQVQSAEEGDLEGYGDLDLAFHRALWEAAKNRRLLRAAESLDGQVRLLISTSAAVPGRLPSALEEHREILEALTASDPEACEVRMRHHIRNAWRALDAHFRAQS